MVYLFIGRMACGDVYRGWFVHGQRQGHGDLTSVDRQGRTIRRYVGSWRQNNASSYGVEEEVTDIADTVFHMALLVHEQRSQTSPSASILVVCVFVCVCVCV